MSNPKTTNQPKALRDQGETIPKLNPSLNPSQEVSDESSQTTKLTSDTSDDLESPHGDDQDIDLSYIHDDGGVEEAPDIQALIDEAHERTKSLDPDAKPMGEVAFFKIFCSTLSRTEKGRAAFARMSGRPGIPFETFTTIAEMPEARPASDALYHFFLNSFMRFIVVGKTGEAVTNLDRFMSIVDFMFTVSGNFAEERSQRIADGIIPAIPSMRVPSNDDFSQDESAIVNQENLP